MANPAVTYTFTNGSVADASQVNQNFTDIINGLTDGTKSLNIDAITAAGKATLNGAVDLGNATGDVITVNGAFAGTGGDASATQKGLVTTAAQEFSGAKTFNGGVVSTYVLSETGTQSCSSGTYTTVKTFTIGATTFGIWLFSWAFKTASSQAYCGNALIQGSNTAVALFNKNDGATSYVQIDSDVNVQIRQDSGSTLTGTWWLTKIS
jgi:hypothetical protein